MGTWVFNTCHCTLMADICIMLSGTDAQISLVPGADEEAFEDNSEEYIRRDLEGSGNFFNSTRPKLNWRIVEVKVFKVD